MLLKNLTNLRFLHFNDMAIYGQSLTLSDDFFMNVPKLEKLFIVHSNLTALPDQTLCNIPNIQVIFNLLIIIHMYIYIYNLIKKLYLFI